MAAFFTIGEQKVRPGVYFRYENYGGPQEAGVTDGVCATVIRSNWGKVGEAVLLEGIEEVAKAFGSGEENTTTNVPIEMFRGGAKRVYVTRLGNGGTNGSCDIKDMTGASALKLVLLYPGSRQFYLVIRNSIKDNSQKELLLLENTEIIQTIVFSKGEDEAKNLMEAYAKSGSQWFTLTKTTTIPNELAIVDQVEIQKGTDPTVNAGSYSAALCVLEPYRWNCIALDTNDVAIQALLQAYLNRIYDSGKFVMGVVAEPTTVPLLTRMKNASAFNDYKIVYVGSGFKDSTGKIYDGYIAAARVAGMIAGTPSNESVTHMAVTGAVDLCEVLTNSQYAQAITSGMLTFSVSAQGVNWIENGINTLVSPGAKEDIGWKKIKRTKVRYELMQRINDTVEVLVGKINNDPDGRATIVQAAQNVANSMIAEKKLLMGAKIVIDPDNAPQGDSAWFVVYADDIDAMEKMYFAFKFRFAPEQ